MHAEKNEPARSINYMHKSCMSSTTLTQQRNRLACFGQNVADHREQKAHRQQHADLYNFTLRFLRSVPKRTKTNLLARFTRQHETNSAHCYHHYTRQYEIEFVVQLLLPSLHILKTNDNVLCVKTVEKNCSDSAMRTVFVDARE